MQVLIEIPGTPIQSTTKKMALEKIAKNFNTANLAKIAELSEIPNADTQIEALFANPFFKMAIKR
jgi:hypothetical protein